MRELSVAEQHFQAVVAGIADGRPRTAAVLRSQLERKDEAPSLLISVTKARLHGRAQVMVIRLSPAKWPPLGLRGQELSAALEN